VKVSRWMLVAGAAAIVCSIALAGSFGASKAPAAAAAKFKSTLVLDTGGPNDNGFNKNKVLGLKKESSKIGGTYLELISNSSSDYAGNYTTAVNAHSNIIIAAGFLLGPTVKTYAHANPKIKFAITGVDVTAPPFNGQVPNIEGLTFATQENAYLAGCLAGLMAKKHSGKQVVGVVAGAGMPLVAAPVAGYSAGARRCNPAVTVLTSYTHDLTNQATCRSLAQRHVKAGSQVEFSVAGKCGVGALEAASRAGIWAIGSGVEQSHLYAAHLLTNVVTRLNHGIFVAIQNAEQGEFVAGGNLALNLKNGGVSLGRINASVPETFVRQINQLKAQIVAGKLKPPTGV